MSLQRFINKERLIWHKRFIPSLIAGISFEVEVKFQKYNTALIYCKKEKY